MFKFVGSCISTFFLSCLFLFCVISLVREINGLDNDITFVDTINFVSKNFDSDSFSSRLWDLLNKEVTRLNDYIKGQYFDIYSSSFDSSSFDSSIVSSIRLELINNQYLNAAFNYVVGAIPFIFRIIYIPILFVVFTVVLSYDFVSFFMFT